MSNPIQHSIQHITNTVLAYFDLHSGAIQAITAVAIVLLTVVLVIANVALSQTNTDLLKEAKKSREQDHRPHVAVVAEERGSQGNGTMICCVIVKNDGGGPAFDITIDIDPLGGRMPQGLPPKTIAYLSPHGERITEIAVKNDIEHRGWRQKIAVHVTWKDMDKGEPMKFDYFIDFNEVAR